MGHRISSRRPCISFACWFCNPSMIRKGNMFSLSLLRRYRFLPHNEAYQQLLIGWTHIVLESSFLPSVLLFSVQWILYMSMKQWISRFDESHVTASAVLPVPFMVNLMAGPKSTIFPHCSVTELSCSTFGIDEALADLKKRRMVNSLLDTHLMRLLRQKDTQSSLICGVKTRTLISKIQSTL